MTEIFGEFIEEGQTSEFLILSFSSSHLSLQDQWRNNSLSADFLSNYWGTFFLEEDSSAFVHAEVKDAVSYIANELLENAIKFHHEKTNLPLQIGIYLCEHTLQFYMTNSVDPETVAPFQAYIQRLLTEDPGELFFQQLERNATNEASTESHLGLLTILNDYQATVAWKFETLPQEPPIITVTTLVELPIVRDVGAA
jgi:hypothetical protein